MLEPGPVILLTTADKGTINMMAMSWHIRRRWRDDHAEISDAIKATNLAEQHIKSAKNSEHHHAEPLIIPMTYFKNGNKCAIKPGQKAR